MGLIEKIFEKTIISSCNALQLISGRFLEVKGELVFDRIKKDVELFCPPNHYTIVINTKTDEWKTAKNLVYAQQKMSEMENPPSCYVKPLNEICLFFEKYNPK